ncbi:MAG: ABC transporter ATP-binding protein [Gemmatimonadaceae bacterium]
MIELRDVTKIYPSLFGQPVRAVEDFSLRAEPGEVLGIAGPNGAGKSTVIALLLGYLAPTRGTVSIAGRPPREYITRHGIGYLSELIAIPPRWTVDRALTRYGLLAGLAGTALAARRDELVELLGLRPHRRKQVRQLSKGNAQRLGLAQALMRDDRVMIFDEPTHGLDPLWIQRFRDLARALRRPDRTMLVASHDLDELQRVADRVAIIDGGRLQRIVDTRAAASAAHGSRQPYVLTLAAGAEGLTAVFPGARPLGGGVYEIPPLDLSALNAGVARLIASGALVSAVAPAYSVLERQFREAVGERTT